MNFVEFSIDVGYANNFGHFADEIDGDKSWSLQSFYFKDEAIPCDTKSPLNFSMWLSWVVYAGPVFWLVLQQEYWEHILVHEFHGWKFVISWDVARLVCMEKSLKCSWQIDVGVQSADPFFRQCLSQLCLKSQVVFSMQKKLQTYHDHHDSWHIPQHHQQHQKHGKNMKKKQHHNQIHFRYQYKQNKEEEEEQQQFWWQFSQKATRTSSIFNQTQLLCPKESFLKILEDAVCSLDIVQEFLGLPLVAESEKFPPTDPGPGVILVSKCYWLDLGVSKN